MQEWKVAHYHIDKLNVCFFKLKLVDTNCFVFQEKLHCSRISSSICTGENELSNISPKYVGSALGRILYSGVLIDTYFLGSKLNRICSLSSFSIIILFGFSPQKYLLAHLNSKSYPRWAAPNALSNCFFLPTGGSRGSRGCASTQQND